MRTTIRLWLIKETDKAYFFSKVTQEKGSSNDGIWVPRSMCERITKGASEPGKWRFCEVEVQEWFAEKKGLI